MRGAWAEAGQNGCARPVIRSRNQSAHDVPVAGVRTSAAARLRSWAPMSTALYFDPDAYTEAHARSGAPGGPAGLMGRQGAGKEFLDACLPHAGAGTLPAGARTPDRGNVLARICRDPPSSADRPRRVVTIPEADFLPAFA